MIGLSIVIPWVSVVLLIAWWLLKSYVSRFPLETISRLTISSLSRVSATTLWKDRPLVKVQDLGYKSSNLQDVPNKEDKKKNRIDAAISNLAASEDRPVRFLPPVPDSLFQGKE